MRSSAGTLVMLGAWSAGLKGAVFPWAAVLGNEHFPSSKSAPGTGHLPDALAWGKAAHPCLSCRLNTDLYQAVAHVLGRSLLLWEPLGQAGLQGQSPSPPAWEAPQWGQHFLLSGWTLEALATSPPGRQEPSPSLPRLVLLLLCVCGGRLGG